MTPDHEIAALNARFPLTETGAARFEAGQNAFPRIRVQSDLATAEIYLHGAHVTAFQPADQEPVIWLSPKASFEKRNAIRGGIPLCWPWFGDHPDDPTQAAHGFARNAAWEVDRLSQDSEGAITIEFRLPEIAIQPPYTSIVEVRLSVRVARELTLELTTRNRSATPATISEALHTYLHVGAIDSTRVEGLDGVSYLDKLDGYQQKQQHGEIHFSGPVDRLYEDTRREVLVHDEALARTLCIGKSNSAATVVWNPWEEGSTKLADMPDDGYRTMLCVEAANAGKHRVSLAPGSSHSIGTSVSIQ